MCDIPLQKQTEGVLVLMVTKDASWQPFCHPLHQLGGAAVVSRISTMDTVPITQTRVSVISLLVQWETLSVVMVSEREMRSVTVEVHKSAQILAVMLPFAS